MQMLSCGGGAAAVAGDVAVVGIVHFSWSMFRLRRRRGLLRSRGFGGAAWGDCVIPESLI